MRKAEADIKAALGTIFQGVNQKTKLKFAIIFVMFLTGCAGEERVYQTGPRGGCYYVSKSGEKHYVDRSMCQERQTKATELGEGDDLKAFRELFVKEFEKVPGCRLLTLEGEFSGGNYNYRGSAVCDGKEDSVRGLVYNATLASGKRVKVMEMYESYHLESKIFIDPESHTVIERVPQR